MAIAAVGGQAGKNVVSPGASVTRAFGSNVAAGSLILIWGVTYKTGTDPLAAGDVTKSAGTATIGTISLDHQHEINDGSGGFLGTGLWSCIVTGAGSLTMALATGGAGNYGLIITNEYTGSFDASRVEAVNQGGTGNNNQTAASGGSVTTAGAGMIAGCLAISTTISGYTMTQDAAFTEVATETDGSTNMVGEAIHRIVGSGTTDDASWTINSNNTGWGAISVAYKEAAGGGGATGRSRIIGGKLVGGILVR